MLATGYNIVDVEAARERDIPVTNVPTYGTRLSFAFLPSLLGHVFDLVLLLWLAYDLPRIDRRAAFALGVVAVAASQLAYVRQMDIGLTGDDVWTLGLPDEVAGRAQVLKTELAEIKALLQEQGMVRADDKPAAPKRRKAAA